MDDRKSSLKYYKVYPVEPHMYEFLSDWLEILKRVPLRTQEEIENIDGIHFSKSGKTADIFYDDFGMTLKKKDGYWFCNDFEEQEWVIQEVKNV